MSTARDWLAGDYRRLEERRAQLDAIHGPLTVPAGTTVRGNQGGIAINSEGRVRLAERLAIRRGQVTIIVGAEGIADRWGHFRTDPAPTLAELKLTSKATAQQVIDALTVYTDPACQCPTFYCTETADHSVIVDGVELFLCADHCDCEAA